MNLHHTMCYIFAASLTLSPHSHTHKHTHTHLLHNHNFMSLHWRMFALSASLLWPLYFLIVLHQHKLFFSWEICSLCNVLVCVCARVCVSQCNMNDGFCRIYIPIGIFRISWATWLLSLYAPLEHNWPSPICCVLSKSSFSFILPCPLKLQLRYFF